MARLAAMPAMAAATARGIGRSPRAIGRRHFDQWLRSRLQIPQIVQQIGGRCQDAPGKEADHAGDPGVEALDRAGQQQRNENEDVLGPLMKPEAPRSSAANTPCLAEKFCSIRLMAKPLAPPTSGRHWKQLMLHDNSAYGLPWGNRVRTPDMLSAHQPVRERRKLAREPYGRNGRRHNALTPSPGGSRKCALAVTNSVRSTVRCEFLNVHSSRVWLASAARRLRDDGVSCAALAQPVAMVQRQAPAYTTSAANSMWWGTGSIHHAASVNGMTSDTPNTKRDSHQPGTTAARRQQPR